MGVRKSVDQYLDLTGVDPLAFVERMVMLGLTDKEIAGVFGLTEHQWYWMMDHHPEVKAQIAMARERPNALVEAALFKRATGFQTKEIVLANGKPTKVIISEFPPDTTACIFWLKNRDSKRWRDAYDVNMTLRDQVARASNLKALPDPNVVDAEAE